MDDPQIIPTMRMDFNDIQRSYHVPLEVLLSLFVEFYETLELPMVHLAYTRSDVVLEGGAGIGFISGWLGKFARRVVSLEAIPEYAEIARANLELNGIDNVTIISGALGVGRAETTFERRTIPYASSVLDGTWSHDEIQNTVTVPQYDINELVREHGVNALHLDLEGGEALILPAVDFTPITKVIMEFHPRVIGVDACQELLNLMMRNGLEAALVGGARNYPSHSYTAVFAREPFASKLREGPFLGDTSPAKFERGART